MLLPERIHAAIARMTLCRAGAAATPLDRNKRKLRLRLAKAPSEGYAKREGRCSFVSGLLKHALAKGHGRIPNPTEEMWRMSFPIKPVKSEATTHGVSMTRRGWMLGVGALCLPLGACGGGGAAQNWGLALPTSAGLNEEMQRGFVFDDAVIATIKPGMDVQTVLQTLGTPSTTSTIGNKTFYYISQTVKRRFQFQNFTVTDQKVLAIYFNKAFKVERIASYGLQDGKVFDFISRTTTSGGEEQSFVRNLFRGVTSFNPLGGFTGG